MSRLDSNASSSAAVAAAAASATAAASTNDDNDHNNNNDNDAQDYLFDKAADALFNSEYLLVLIGPGFDDGGTARNPFSSEASSYKTAKFPNKFFGFWGSYFNDAQDRQPHSGYQFLYQWRNNSFAPGTQPGTNKVLKPAQNAAQAADDANGPKTKGIEGGKSNFQLLQQRMFCATSLVNNMLAKAGFNADEIYEVCGNVTQWQCGSSPRCGPPFTVQLEKNTVFDIDESTGEALPLKYVPPGEETSAVSGASAGGAAGAAAAAAGSDAEARARRITADEPRLSLSDKLAMSDNDAEEEDYDRLVRNAKLYDRNPELYGGGSDSKPSVGRSLGSNPENVFQPLAAHNAFLGLETRLGKEERLRRDMRREQRARVIRVKREWQFGVEKFPLDPVKGLVKEVAVPIAQLPIPQTVLFDDEGVRQAVQATEGALLLAQNSIFSSSSSGQDAAAMAAAAVLAADQEAGGGAGDENGGGEVQDKDEKNNNNNTDGNGGDDNEEDKKSSASESAAAAAAGVAGGATSSNNNNNNASINPLLSRPQSAMASRPGSKITAIHQIPRPKMVSHLYCHSQVLDRGMHADRIGHFFVVEAKKYANEREAMSAALYGQKSFPSDAQHGTAKRANTVRYNVSAVFIVEDNAGSASENNNNNNSNGAASGSGSAASSFHQPLHHLDSLAPSVAASARGGASSAAAAPAGFRGGIAAALNADVIRQAANQVVAGAAASPAHSTAASMILAAAANTQAGNNNTNLLQTIVMQPSSTAVPITFEERKLLGGFGTRVLPPDCANKLFRPGQSLSDAAASANSANLFAGSAYKVEQHAVSVSPAERKTQSILAENTSVQGRNGWYFFSHVAPQKTCTEPIRNLLYDVVRIPFPEYRKLENEGIAGAGGQVGSTSSSSNSPINKPFFGGNKEPNSQTGSARNNNNNSNNAITNADNVLLRRLPPRGGKVSIVVDMLQIFNLGAGPSIVPEYGYSARTFQVVGILPPANALSLPPEATAAAFGPNSMGGAGGGGGGGGGVGGYGARTFGGGIMTSAAAAAAAVPKYVEFALETTGNCPFSVRIGVLAAHPDIIQYMDFDIPVGRAESQLIAQTFGRGGNAALSSAAASSSSSSSTAGAAAAKRSAANNSLAAKVAQTHGGLPALLKPVPNHLFCPHCKALARPHVVMVPFNAPAGTKDPVFSYAAQNPKTRLFNGWLKLVCDALKSDQTKTMCVLELGAEKRPDATKTVGERTWKVMATTANGRLRYVRLSSQKLDSSKLVKKQGGGGGGGMGNGGTSSSGKTGKDRKSGTGGGADDEDDTGGFIAIQCNPAQGLQRLDGLLFDRKHKKG